MRRHALWLVFLLLAAATWLPAQPSSNLVGTWVGKVRGFDLEMRRALNPDDTADFGGDPDTGKAQGSRLLMTQDGETSAYNFQLQGARLILSGGDLMAAMALTRAGGPLPALRGLTPGTFRSARPQQGNIQPENVELPMEANPLASGTSAAGSARGLRKAEVADLLEAGVSERSLRDLVAERGISFGVATAAATRLSKKGASEGLLTADGESGQTARWTAEGGEPQGVVNVTYPSGGTSQFQYRRSGTDLIVGGRKYGRYGDGSCAKTSVD